MIGSTYLGIAGIMKGGVFNPEADISLDSITDKLPVLEAVIKVGVAVSRAS